MAVAFVAMAGCGGADETGDPPTSASTSPAPAACLAPDDCTLAEAGAGADLMVGTAGKWSSPERIELQAREFSAVTNENELLWSVVHPAPDQWRWEGGDRVVAAADEHDQEMTLTHFVWDPPSLREVLPDWVREVTEPDELRTVMREHLETLAGRYRDGVDRLTVVNEPLDNEGDLEVQNHFRQVLGDDYIAEAFAIAAEVWPEASLILNENLVEYSPAKADGLVALVEDLQARGVPVDGVGLQMHLFIGEPDWALLDDTMARLDALEVDIAVTELDVPLLDPGDTLELQAEWARRVVAACLAVGRCSSITFWGFDDGDTWLDSFLAPGTRPLLYDERLRPKPMYDAVYAELLEGRR